MGVAIVTLGCRLNTLESEAMKRHAEAAGQDDLVIVNTCAVTSEAVAQARQTIRKLRRADAKTRIVVTGCAAQIDPAAFAAMPEVSAVVGNDIKTLPGTWAATGAATGGFAPETPRVRVNDIMRLRETAGHFVESMEGRTRAFLEVQNGCDHRCTFCVIPFGRGNARSSPMGEVVAQVERIVDGGVPEIVLTGVDLTSYGTDLPGAPRLGTLVGAILKHVPALKRLRLSSIDSIEADPLLVDLLKSERRLMPHLRLSLQQGDNLILKRMKRRHTREEAIRFCADLRAARPDFAFGADLIAGFPTETEEQFANTLALLEDCGLAFLHAFPFSPRPGTPAAKMPQLPRPVVKERAARLRAAGEAALARHLANHVGATRNVLIERGGTGRLDDFTPVRLSTSPEPGTLAKARITGHDGTRLHGETLGAER